MAKTKNKYIVPVDKDKIIKINPKEHPPDLKYAIDYVISEGTPVKTATDGIVVEVKDDSNITGPTREEFEKYGNYIEILHPNNEYAEYHHLKKGGAFVKTGEKVKKGQVIGLSGNTGWSTIGPHLHFMVYKYIDKNNKNKWKNLKIIFEKE